MGEKERAIIHHSVGDVIKVLENEPVRPDMIFELTAAQVINRVSIAHLSIERAMKFVITESGGPLIKNHDLPSRLNELRQYEPESAKFLGEAFEDAVRHYRYNANAIHMKHLKSLDSYLEATGSDESFQDIRYWELTQSTNEMILRRIYLTLHMELLHAMSEILLAPERPKDIVSTRVERAVGDAMFSNREPSYSPGSEKERSVESYIEWLKGYESFVDAIVHEFNEKSTDRNKFRMAILREAYQELSVSKDPAIKYFAETLTVLPKQQRHAIPCVKWLGPEKFRSGIVSTPGGNTLGYIDRRTDGRWAITPSRNGPVMVAAISESQTDARCYLAELLTRNARVIVDDEVRQLRLVGNEYDLIRGDYGTAVNSWEDTENSGEPAFEITFWDAEHGLTAGTPVRLEAPSRNTPRVLHILVGTVAKVKDHQVVVRGRNYFEAE